MCREEIRQAGDCAASGYNNDIEMRPGTGPQLWSPGTRSAAIMNIAEGVEEDDDEWTRPNTTVTPQ